MNCNNCTHFSPFAKTKYIDIDIYKKDLLRLKSLIGGSIKRIILMGGKPLLHPLIKDFFKITRDIFPNVELQLLTNGILLKNMNEVFWKSCKKYNIQINITPYPININYVDIYNLVLKHKLKLFIYDDGNTFNKKFIKLDFISNKDKDSINNFKKCNMSKCTNLKNGKLYLCPITNNINRYNSYYKTNYLINDSDYLDIYKIKNSKKIFDFIKKSTDFCKYCKINEIECVPWERFNEKI